MCQRGKIEKLAADLEINSTLAAPFEGNSGLVKAWDVLYDLPALRVNTAKIEVVSNFTAIKNIDASVVKTELNALPSYKEALIKGFEVSNGRFRFLK